MNGTQLSDGPLVRVVSPDGADWIDIATSYAGFVPGDAAARLVHGWGVADHDHDVQAYTRVEV